MKTRLRYLFINMHRGTRRQTLIDVMLHLSYTTAFHDQLKFLRTACRSLRQLHPKHFTDSRTKVWSHARNPSLHTMCLFVGVLRGATVQIPTSRYGMEHVSTCCTLGLALAHGLANPAPFFKGVPVQHKSTSHLGVVHFGSVVCKHAGSAEREEMR